MKQALTLLTFICLMVAGCTTDTQTTNWINRSQHPIICITSNYKPDSSSHTYFLIDATGKTFIANQITAVLPDTIK